MAAFKFINKRGGSAGRAYLLLVLGHQRTNTWPGADMSST